MALTIPNITLFLAALATALMAGLFYSYSCSVNPGLAKLPDEHYLSAMQSINRAILNPAFFAAFLGALVLLPLSTWLNYDNGSLRFWLLGAATIIYAAGLFSITISGNVPLNEMLDAFSIESATAAEAADMRSRFEGPWNRWHTIRTIAVIVSFMLVMAACLAPNVKNPVQ